MTEARVLTWSQLETDRPMALIERRRIMGEHMMVSEVRLAAGFTVGTHQHANEQIAMVMSGRIRFTVGSDAREVELVAGQVLVLPPECPHSAVAIEDTVILDLFSPPSATTGVDQG